MFKTRAIVSLTLAPLALLIIYLGGWLLLVTIAALLVVGGFEFSRIMAHHGWPASPWLLGGGTVLLLASAYWPAVFPVSLIFSAAVFAALLLALWQYERGATANVTGGLLANFGGIIFLGWLGRHILLLRTLDDDGQWLIMVVAIIWLSDTFAYLIGSRFGRHQLTPRLSPKKSIEGYLAGFALGTAAGVVFKLLFLPALPWTAALILGLVLTPIIPAGDLGFSLLKREAGVKDAGQLFPGHGGVLDRFDTVLWGSTIAYYLISNFF